MGSDWDYINEHLGGHDEDGMPNFLHATNAKLEIEEIEREKQQFHDDIKSKYGSDYVKDIVVEFFYDERVLFFENFSDAKKWAKTHVGKSITKSPDGSGYVVKIE